ncbi:hypothetical protein GYMLUDRAFT_50837 [Collybiopsis luxurians FD-317 M1]|uniref:Uncharacterized protein n=1 Tax=Collybiopsis luxurians FD-317 M1 TaxID=944289 RepID=A0A0D0C8H8_9AGAR|nr:hypothetical protein GYMLUDRAFT_50837 [Collybiopsis luxurians FD-317 M1]
MSYGEEEEDGHSPPQRALHCTFKRLRKLRHPVHPIRRGSRPSSPPLKHRLRVQIQPIPSPSHGFFTLVRMAEPVLVQWFSNWLIQIYNNICYRITIMFPVLDSTSDGDSLTIRTSFLSIPSQDRRPTVEFGEILGVGFGHVADDGGTNDEGDDRCRGECLDNDEHYMSSSERAHRTIDVV